MKPDLLYIVCLRSGYLKMGLNCAFCFFPGGGRKDIMSSHSLNRVSG